MKKINLFMFSAFVLFGFALNVNAEGCTDNCVAKIGDEKYASLADAVENADTTQTIIEILADSTTERGIFVGASNPKNVVVDLKGHTLKFNDQLVGSTGTENQNIHIEKGSTFVFKNGTLVANAKANFLIQNYADLTIENMTLDTSKSTASWSYALSSNKGLVSITGNTNIYASDVAFDMCWAPNKGYLEGTQITLDTTGTIKGIIELDVWGAFADSVKSTLNIKNVNHEGKFSVDPKLVSQLTIEGGTYSEDVTDYLKDNTLVITSTDKGYVVEAVKSIETTDKNVILESEDALQNDYVLVVKDAIEELTEEEVKNVTSNVEETVNKLAESNKTIAEDIKLLALYDITVNDGTGVVELENGKYTITLTLNEELLKYDRYVVVYINDEGEVVEKLPVTVDGNNAIFTTSHLSTYGVVGYNVVEDSKLEISNPDTLDNILTYVALGFVALIGVVVCNLYLKKRMN